MIHSAIRHIFLFTCAALVLAAQPYYATSTARKIQPVGTDPTGGTCSAGDVRSYGGAIYTCSSGTYAAIGAGSFSVASQAEAEAGTSNTKGMTPLQVANALKVNVEADSLLTATPTTAGVEIGVGTLLVRISSGVAASLPGSCTLLSQVYYATDTESVYWCDGTNYNVVGATANPVTAGSAAGSANLPVFSNAADRTVKYGTRSGDTLEVVTVDGSKTVGKHTEFDADGNLKAAAFNIPVRLCELAAVTGITSTAANVGGSDIASCAITTAVGLAAGDRIRCFGSVVRVNTGDTAKLYIGMTINGTLLAGGTQGSASGAALLMDYTSYQVSTASQINVSNSMRDATTATAGNGTATAGYQTTVDTTTTTLTLGFRAAFELSGYTDDTADYKGGYCDLYRH